MTISNNNDVQSNSKPIRLGMKGPNPAILPLVIWGFCLFLAIVYLLICTKSSPLYPFNDWVDANAIFTMGKGMMNGKVLYRDLFEQKGPLLYFIQGLAYLISAKSFLGVFVFEVGSFAFFLFFSFKSLSLFMDRKYSLIFLPIITTLVLNLKSFVQGNSAEEFVLPLMAVSLYYLLRYFKSNDAIPSSFKWIFWNGIIAGCVLWIKFSMLGFWIGWMASLILCMLAKKQSLSGIKASLLFLSGLLIATLPWIVYFGMNHSIPEWINTFIILNLTSYPSSAPILSNLGTMLVIIAYQISVNPIANGLLWLGVIVFIAFDKFLKNRLYRISLFFCILFFLLGIYGGGRGYIYYYLIVSPLLNLGVIVLQDLINTRMNKSISLKSTAIVIFITLVSTIFITLQFNQNTPMLKVKKEDLVQFKYARIINQTENVTLLNYGSLDLGFYTTTGITPNIRFFEKQNLSYSRFPMNMDEQNRYIKEKVVDFIVFVWPTSDKVEILKIPYLYKNYQLIEVQEQGYEKDSYSYYLFKKIE